MFPQRVFDKAFDAKYKDLVSSQIQTVNGEFRKKFILETYIKLQDILKRFLTEVLPSDDTDCSSFSLF